ncbi:unnamed protein product, partial [Didymodactylos carnosus]
SMLKVFHLECISHYICFNRLKSILSRCHLIQCFLLNVAFQNYIDGDQIHNDLLSLLINLKEFYFNISYPTYSNIKQNVHNYLLKFNRPLFYYFNMAWHRHCVFSLPYAFEQINLAQNDIIHYQTMYTDNLFSYSNQHQLKQIIFVDLGLCSLELIQFIIKIFPNIEHLKLQSYC